MTDEPIRQIERLDSKGRERPANSTPWELFKIRTAYRIRRLWCLLHGGHRRVTVAGLVAWIELDGTRDWKTGDTKRCWFCHAMLDDFSVVLEDRTVAHVHIEGFGVLVQRLVIKWDGSEGNAGVYCGGDNSTMRDLYIERVPESVFGVGTA